MIRMKCRLHAFAFVALTIALMALAQSASGIDRPWNRDIIYFALTDRFFDGDPANNVPPGSDPALYDPAQQDVAKYHGGDLRGLEKAIASGYFEALGVTAIWITPPVRNVWNSEHDLGGAKTGYHGYWAQDFLDIDPHLTSDRSLDGVTDYPDTRDGRMQHYKDFVALAHSRGIKIVQDIVCNHAGPVFFYDADGDAHFDLAEKSEWIQPFQRSGFHGNARWADEPRWNVRRTEPAGPLTILGREVKANGILAQLESYGRKGFSDSSLGKSDGEEMECDFFALRDFWTAPGSAHFDRLVDEFVKIYRFYIEEIGVDGLRIDTVKHVHHEFWDAFTERLRARLGERAKRVLLFGEVYDGDPAKIGRYTFRADAQRREPCLDSVLNFSLCFTAREYLRPGAGSFGSGKPLEKMLRATSGMEQGRFFNPAPGLDGLNASEKAINFVENHDGLNRFRVAGVSERQHLLAQALVLTLEGIPCLYYGAETALADDRGRIGHDSKTGRLTFVRAGRFEEFAAAKTSRAFRAIAALTRLRRELPALATGVFSPLWTDSDADTADDGVFAYARYFRDGSGGFDPSATVVVAFNASDRERVTRASGAAMRLVSRSGKPIVAEGAKLQRVRIDGLDGPETPQPAVEVAWRDGFPHAALQLPPQSVNIYRVDRK